MSKNATYRLALVSALVAVLVTACGGESEPAGGAAGDETGRIDVSGSSTVEPITALIQEAFNTENPDIGISVEGPGTGDGFARFCNGETDISDASRPIKDSEAENCASAGIEFVELKVAIDGISVLTSPDNEAVACLDYHDLYALLGPESEGFETWADANDLAAEVGAGHAPYPDVDLVITAPGEESGTFDSFVELVIEDIADERGTDHTTRADYSPEANDNVIVNNLSSNPTSLGWVGYAFYVENSAVVKAIEIDGGNGCVAPSDAAIADGSYPIARELFIYVKTNDLASNTALVEFVDHYLSDEGMQAVSEAGYVQLPADELAATRSAWEAARP